MDISYPQFRVKQGLTHANPSIENEISAFLESGNKLQLFFFSCLTRLLESMLGAGQQRYKIEQFNKPKMMMKTRESTLPFPTVIFAKQTGLHFTLNSTLVTKEVSTSQKGEKFAIKGENK